MIAAWNRVMAMAWSTLYAVELLLWIFGVYGILQIIGLLKPLLIVQI